MNYLIVVAHPDDEVLGAGASIYNWSKNNQVDVCMMCSKAEARALQPAETNLDEDIDTAKHFLGINKVYKGLFPNIEMNRVSHLQIVQFIEKAIVESKPDIIITHHTSDVNNDHMQTSMACQEAVRIFQRRPDVKPVSEIWFMEVSTASEWNINSSLNSFRPNCYVEVGKDGVDKKIQALKIYKGVMRPYPHPRSHEAIEGLAAYRGCQCGLNYAEAFEVGFRRITDKTL